MKFKPVVVPIIKQWCIIFKLKQLKSEESQQTDTEIICALLEAKADVDIKNKQGKTPVDLAVDDDIKTFMIR